MDNYYRDRGDDDALLERARAHAQNRAEAWSVRVLAESVGVGHSTLHNFLRGAMPHPRIRRLILAWYAHDMDAASRAAEDALGKLLSFLPSGHHPQAATRLLRCVEEVYRDAGVDPPAWTIGRVRVRPPLPSGSLGPDQAAD